MEPESDTAQRSTARTGAPVSSLNQAQRAALQRVGAYFNSVQTLVANFQQTGPDGQRTNGKLFLEKPGKIRFYYAAPSRLDIISDGTSVAVRDRKLNTQDLWPLKQTPLRFLLAEKLDLLRDSNVIGVFQEAEMISVVLEEKNAIGGRSQLQLMFGGADYQLKQWTVTDAQGQETSVELSNLDTATKPDPRVFAINQQRVLGPGR
jgi:outer membrane lipoprotein-sorting protein